MHGDELYGNLTKITGPGGKIVTLLVSDPDQVAQICLNEEVFQKNKPNKHSPLGIIWGNENKVGLFFQGMEVTDWGIGHQILINAFC